MCYPTSIGALLTHRFVEFGEERIDNFDVAVNIVLVKLGLRKRALTPLWGITDVHRRFIESDADLWLYILERRLSDGRTIGDAWICRSGDRLIEDHIAQGWKGYEDVQFIGQALGYPEKAVAFFQHRQGDQAYLCIKAQMHDDNLQSDILGFITSVEDSEELFSLLCEQVELWNASLSPFNICLSSHRYLPK